jgi:hypothetical protein
MCWTCVNTNSLIHWEPISLSRRISTAKPNEVVPVSRLEYAALHQAETPKSALDTQVAGNHYKTLKIQPMEYSMGNKLDACQHTAIKYITRFRSKGGKQDLEKAKHAIDMLIEFEYGSY